MTTLAVDERIAFDRSASARTYDEDGRLKVEMANISKANICPYLGREIPGFEDLGLDPKRIYKMLRHPEELEKAAQTFDGIPLQQVHEHHTAADPIQDKVVGTTGTGAKFEAPYLRAPLSIWTKDAIDNIESDKTKELSSSYHYDPDMTPGEFEGEPYDGVMRNIRGNHVALVKEGRAGPDVVVGDSKENLNMAKIVLTRKAALVAGAVIAHLQPKLAKDVKLDIAPAFKGVGAKNFKASKPNIVKAIEAATKGKLAADASLEGLTELLDALEDVPIDEGKDEETVNPAPAPVELENDSPSEALKAHLKGKLSDEDYAKACELMGGAAEDEGNPDAPEKPEGGEKKPAPVTKAAMDKAIAAAVKSATETANKNQSAIRDAERAVRPWVGELTVAHDSAEAVYRTALKALGHPKADTLHADALSSVLETFAKPGSRNAPAPAMDEAGAKSFAERFPDTARIAQL